MINDYEPYDHYIKRMYKETEMGTLENRLASLRAKHKDLDTRIEVLYAEKAPDEYISKLKKEKLSLKDEIIDLEKL